MALEPVSFDSYTIRYFMLLIMIVLKTRFLLQFIEIVKKSAVDWYNTLFPFSSVAGPQFTDREHCKQVKTFPEKITVHLDGKQVFMHV